MGNIASQACRASFKRLPCSRSHALLAPAVVSGGAIASAWNQRTQSNYIATEESDTPACVECTRRAARVFCGGEHTLIRDAETLEVYQLGACGLGFDHDGTSGETAKYIQHVPLPGPAASVFAGYYHNMFRLNGGRCFAFGCGRQAPNDGQLLNGSLVEETQPSSTTLSFADASLGGHHTVCRTRAGEVWACGAGWQGQMGNGGLEYKNAASQRVPGLPRIQKIYGGYYHNVAMSEDGVWYVWGCNEQSQVGPAGDAQLRSPQKLEELVPELHGKQIKDCDGGYGHTVFLLGDGTIFTLGAHFDGQRGLNPELEIAPLANKVDGLPGLASDIAAGNHHTLAIVAGKVYGFGSDEYGQVRGVGSPPEDVDHQVWTPEPVVGLPENDPVIRISAGICHSAAQTASGRVFLWGCGSNGQTGDASLPSSSSVVEIDMLKLKQHF